MMPLTATRPAIVTNTLERRPRYGSSAGIFRIAYMGMR